MTPLHAVHADRLVLQPQRRWLDGDPSLTEIGDDVARPLNAWPGRGWFICFAAAFSALAVGVACVSYEVATGIGV